MKKAVRLFAVLACTIFVASLQSTQGVLAATPTTISVGPTPPPSTAPNLIITSIVGSALPDYVELFNQSDAPFNLDGWSVALTVHDNGPAGCTDIVASVPMPASWLLSKKYLTLERTSTPAPGSTTIPFAIDSAALVGCIAPQLATAAITQNNSDPEQLVTIPADKWSPTVMTVVQHKQRGNSPSSARAITGDFLTDYKIVTGDISLDSDPLYGPSPDAAGLQILEILPNARDCSPLDTDPTCSDYIKLYNPTDQPINLAAYRLRIGYKGQSESITNTFTWGSELDPSQDELILPSGQYFMLTTRNDDQPISITDSGNYVWLEDAYGTTIYEPLVAYPDASSTTKVGYAWAYDGSSWQWTATPQPNAANYFPPIPIISDSSGTTTTSVSVLKSCAIGQYRNPDTNRCKSIVTASSASLTPCSPDQERNPATNRCRSIVAASAILTPCQPGWERNPDTNRCRKSTSATLGATTAKIQDITAPSASSPTGWIVAIVAVVAALAYAVYEWRQEIRLATEKVKAKGLSLLPEQFIRRRKN